LYDTSRLYYAKANIGKTTGNLTSVFNAPSFFL
jgi:hypothetical protein